MQAKKYYSIDKELVRHLMTDHSYTQEDINYYSLEYNGLERSHEWEHRAKTQT